MEVECVTTSDYKACILSSEQVFKKSEDIIQRRKGLLKQLEDSLVTPDHREFMANLIYSISLIQGFIDGASSWLAVKELDMPDDIGQGIKEIMDTTYSMMENFTDSIELLNENLENALEKTDNVRSMEEKVDALRRSLLKKIINSEEESDYKTLYCLSEITRSMDALSDTIDKAANNVEIIALTHLP